MSDAVQPVKYWTDTKPVRDYIHHTVGLPDGVVKMIADFIEDKNIWSFDDWREHGFGIPETGSLVTDIRPRLNQPCPVYGDKGLTMGETHFSIAIPPRLDGEFATLPRIAEVVSKINPSIKVIYADETEHYIGTPRVRTALSKLEYEAPFWAFVLIYPLSIDQSESRKDLRSVDFTVHESVRRVRRATPAGYGTPDIRTLAIAYFLHHIRTRKWPSPGAFPSSSTVETDAMLQIVTSDQGKMIIGSSEFTRFTKVCIAQIYNAFTPPSLTHLVSPSSSTNSSALEPLMLPSSALANSGAASAEKKEDDA